MCLINNYKFRLAIRPFLYIENSMTLALYFKLGSFKITKITLDKIHLRLKFRSPITSQNQSKTRNHI